MYIDLESFEKCWKNHMSYTDSMLADLNFLSYIYGQYMAVLCTGWGESSTRSQTASKRGW